MQSETQLQLGIAPSRPKGQLLKWVGNKYRYVYELIEYFPPNPRCYYEPFVGTGAVLATLAPEKAVAGDTLGPLIELWNYVKNEPKRVVDYYTKHIEKFYDSPEVTYSEIRERFNHSPNGLDLLLLSRTCYGGVVRFTQEGSMSTAMGPHRPITPEKFARRAFEWSHRVRGTIFHHQSFEITMAEAAEGDLVYCDPPYVDSQSILYGAQEFDFHELLAAIRQCKERGARVALSIDGKKKSGKKDIALQIPHDLFERELFIAGGSSMLKRFQCEGATMIGEDVQDRLLLSW